MPIYEYHCESCGHEFELMESMNSDQAKECPVCHKAAHRKISASAFHLKGGGWYTTDYKKSKRCPAAQEDSPVCQACGTDE